MLNKMKQIKLHLLALLVIMSVSFIEADEDIQYTDEQLEEFKNKIESEISAKGITCDNYNEMCFRDEEEKIGPCRITMYYYLCEDFTDFRGLRYILRKIKKFIDSMIEDAE